MLAAIPCVVLLIGCPPSFTDICSGTACGVAAEGGVGPMDSGHDGDPPFPKNGRIELTSGKGAVTGSESQGYNASVQFIDSTGVVSRGPCKVSRDGPCTVAECAANAFDGVLVGAGKISIRGGHD